MRKTLLTVLFIIGISSNAFNQGFYDINTINTIEIVFVETNWDQILDNYYAAGNEERLAGTAFINGVQYDSVGVRYKGNSTYSPNRTKSPLNIKLDYIINNQTLEGFGTLKLANVWKDPSFVREALSYEIARKYMPASEANFINVYINGNLIGLYSSVQDVDKHFVGSHFHNDENVRFKGELTAGGPPTLTPIWTYLGADSASYHNYYELDAGSGWHKLIGFLDTLNNHSHAVEEVLNVDRHLWMLAYDLLLVNLDAPVNFAHNYYLYQDDAGRFNPIIWDLNESFGGFSRLLTGGGLNTTQMQQLTPFLNLTDTRFPIISKVLSNPSYKKQYIAHMKTMMEENFSNNWYSTRAQEIQNIIANDVQADPNKFYSYNDFLSNLNNTIGGGGPGPGNQPIVGITQLMSARITYLSSLAEFQAQFPEISNITSMPETAQPYANVTFNASITNADSVLLAYRKHDAERFTKAEMFDDGNHDDGAAGDGVYGVSITAGASDIQYYIYAENNEAARFSPERAAYEFYTLEVAAGDLVINEFMADNDTTVADQDGEFDDWVELYNNSSAAISLNGLYLSDDGADLTQWAFPDTSIAANSYLIIWADNDTMQAGLHANFAISRNGESLYLTDADGVTVFDQITFGAQAADLSSGRYPNGAGDFMELIPTYSADNAGGVAGLEDASTDAIPLQFNLRQNYPNPFNPSTTIAFSLTRSNQVSLEIYNLAGQKMATIAKGDLPAGDHSYQWQAARFASGVYFYTLKTPAYSETKKMILLK